MIKILAYLDPGTGSMILQAVIGLIAAAGIFFRDAIGRIFSRSKKNKQKKPKD